MNIKCEDCGFLANDDLSLEVHCATTYSGSFECALCGFAAKDEDTLNIHHYTCETLKHSAAVSIPIIVLK